MIEVIKYPGKGEWQKILARPSINNESIETAVENILLAVKNNGDVALKKFVLQFDNLTVEDFLVSEDEFLQAEKSVSSELKQAIQLAKTNIEKFHSAQVEKVVVVETAPGVQCWRKSVGIQKVGIYVPSGTAPLFSTVLMLGIPAKIAGCDEIIMCSPADQNGKINDAILYTAKLVGISKVYKIGGAQAIAAMAYGTESIPAVYKIVGPGNRYVTCAKQKVLIKGIAIDMPAGPSELMIFADETSVPEFVAADLLSQAEHGVDSQVILISTNEKTIELVKQELQIQLEILPRAEIAKGALANSKFILVNNEEESLVLINEYAPEHLILVCKNANDVSEKIVNAGSVFIGNYSCESLGDYASGTNHTLPTNGYAKSYSGVSVDTFVKKITFQQITKLGIEKIGPSVEIMAEAEELQAHKNAVSLRLKNRKNEL